MIHTLIGWRQVKQWINHVYDNVTEDVVVVLALLGLEKKKERVIKGSKIKVTNSF